MYSVFLCLGCLSQNNRKMLFENDNKQKKKNKKLKKENVEEWSKGGKEDKISSNILERFSMLFASN